MGIGQVENVQAFQVEDRIVVTWDAVPNAIGYDVVCSTPNAGQNPMYAEVEGTIWQGSGLVMGGGNFAVGGTYHFRVRAFMEDGE